MNEKQDTAHEPYRPEAEPKWASSSMKLVHRGYAAEVDAFVSHFRWKVVSKSIGDSYMCGFVEASGIEETQALAVAKAERVIKLLADAFGDGAAK